jgi:adenylate cyclase
MSDEPTQTEIASALERILSSSSFANARRAQAFLRFVTTETLAGRAHAITGRTIAIAVFGRPPTFDAGGNPLVRVEAARLRARLREYYATSGSGDSVRIDLRPGNYVPSFRIAATLRNPTVIEARPSRAIKYVGLVIGGLVAVTGIIGAIAMWWGGVGGRSEDYRAPPAVAAAHSGPRILVQPFAAGESVEAATLAFGITEEILTRLGSYRDLQVLVRSPADGTAGADFVLSGSVVVTDDAFRIQPRLVDARSGRRVWMAHYDEPFSSDAVWEVVDSIAGTVAASVGEPYGPLFDAELARRIPETSVDPYHCLLRFVFALQFISEATHARATTCFEQVVAADPGSSMSWARLAALYRMEYLHDFNAQRAAPLALDRAADAARRAVDLDADNPFAHEEMAFLCLLRDDVAGFDSAVARTLALNPSADIRTALGINFIKMGQVERGRALIDEGIADSPRAPPFFFMGYAVDALRTRDYGAAYQWAQRMATRDWPLSQAFLAATAALAGHPERGRAAAERLLELRPAFAVTGRDLIARGRLGEEVEAELVRGLALAGVALD